MAYEKTLLRHNVVNIDTAINVTVHNIQEKVKEIIGCDPLGHYIRYIQKYTNANIEDEYTGIVVADYENFYVIKAELPENRTLTIGINKADIVCRSAKVEVIY